MIVLDADSLMTGSTIVRLVDALERHPYVGLLRFSNGRSEEP
jgi:membrane glycosyltransferase